MSGAATDRASDRAAGRPVILSAAEIDRWMRAARVGEVIVYARAQFLPRDARGPAYMRDLARRDLVALQPLRAEPGPEMQRLFVYSARRTALPADGRRRRETGERAEAEQIVGMIADAAINGEPCPSQERLAAMLGHGSVARVRRIMAALHESGRIGIAVERDRFMTPRRIAILPGSGLMTGVAA